ncbi:MAG: ferredoxin [Desulfuromonadaceae bacterium]|nr:ferredoxin [Desulfuromonadaceae bacterium]MDD2855082.1 ferredoxin [Desulfuromonadaceae bacterium]
MIKSVWVNQDECIICGICVANVPDAFRFKDAGKAEAFDHAR